MDQRTNDDWLSGLRARDDEVLRALFRFLARGLRRSLGARGDVDDAFCEDIAQEASLRVIERLDSFEGRSRVTTWAMSVAVRIALTELRRRRHRDVSFDELVADGALVSDDERERPEVGESLDRHRIVEALRAVVERSLTERQRLAIRAELEGVPMCEIARHLGSNRNAIYKLTHDARKKLAKGLEEAGYDAARIRDVFRF